MQDAGYRIQDTGYRMKDARCLLYTIKNQNLIA
jgi:hypothetical protein